MVEGPRLDIQRYQGGTSTKQFTTQVMLCNWVAGTVTKAEPWWIWKLIPVKVEGTPASSQSSSEASGSGSPPSYNGDTTGQSSTRTQNTESEHDDFGTIVTKITTTSTIVTTRERYRVERAQ